MISPQACALSVKTKPPAGDLPTGARQTAPQALGVERQNRRRPCRNRRFQHTQPKLNHLNIVRSGRLFEGDATSSRGLARHPGTIAESNFLPCSTLTRRLSDGSHGQQLSKARVETDTAIYTDHPQPEGPLASHREVDLHRDQSDLEEGRT